MPKPASNSPDDSLWASRSEEMEAFDRLPAIVQEALRQTRVQWSALSIERLMTQRNIPPETIVERLIRADADS